MVFRYLQKFSFNMESQEEIVVYSSFDSTIDANLAKTKLDAFGIPCFLTEEHMSSLYPGQGSLGLRVRLHIFKKDTEEATRILMEVQSHESASEVNCPKCHSKKIVREFPKRLSQEGLSSIIITFFGIFVPEKKVNHCLDCDNEF